MSERPLSATEEYLLAFWRDLFARGDIGVDDDFFVLGGHSLLAARLSTRVADLFGLEVPLAQVFETPTIAELSAYIDGQRAVDQDPALLPSSLVRLKPGTARPPLFCMHTLMGGVSDYLLFARQFGSEQPVYAVQGQGLIDNELPASTVEGMAAHCVKEIRKLQPQGPYHLVGASFAGLVVFEAARQLRAAGENVALLALFDTWLPYRPSSLQLKVYFLRYIRLQQLRSSYHFNRQRRAAYSHLIQLKPLPPREKLRYVRAKWAMLRERILDKDARRSRSAGLAKPGEVMELEVRHNRMLHASHAALMRYRPSPYDGKVIYLYATNRKGAPLFDQRQAWSHLARGGLELHHILGSHHAMLGPPNVEKVSRILEDCLERLYLEELTHV
ncbi:MAG: thioesterase domain-containing protein [Chloroflexia bacterium]